MKHVLLIIIFMYTVLLVGCTPIEIQTEESETALPTPAEEIATNLPAPTETPEMTPEEKIAFDKAVEFLGDKAFYFQFENIRYAGLATYHVYFKRKYHDLTVVGTGNSVFVEDQGNVWGNIAYGPNLYLPSLTPVASLDEVVTTAIQKIGIQGDLKLQPDAELVVYPLQSVGEPNPIYILAWVFSLNTDCPLGTWAITANAYDGSLLSLINVRESFLPIVSDCPTPFPLPSITPAPYTPMPTATLSNYPPPAVTEAPPTVEATATSEAYPPVSSEIAPTPTEESTPVSTLTS